jgi:hypothetical protein
MAYTDKGTSLVKNVQYWNELNLIRQYKILNKLKFGLNLWHFIQELNEIC